MKRSQFWISLVTAWAMVIAPLPTFASHGGGGGHGGGGHGGGGGHMGGGHMGGGGFHGGGMSHGGFHGGGMSHSVPMHNFHSAPMHSAPMHSYRAAPMHSGGSIAPRSNGHAVSPGARMGSAPAMHHQPSLGSAAGRHPSVGAVGNAGVTHGRVAPNLGGIGNAGRPGVNLGGHNHGVAGSATGNHNNIGGHNIGTHNVARPMIGSGGLGHSGLGNGGVGNLGGTHHASHGGLGSAGAGNIGGHHHTISNSGLVNHHGLGGNNVGDHHVGGNGGNVNLHHHNHGGIGNNGNYGGNNNNWNHHRGGWNNNYVNNYHRNFYRGAWGGFNRFYLPYGGYGLGGFGYGGYGLGGFGLGGYGGYGGYGSGGYGGYGYGGYSPWGYNSTAYGWGYSSYYNPYCSSYAGYPYNYTQPVIINYSVAPATTAVVDGSADPSTVDPAVQRQFEAARAAFTAGDYPAALSGLDSVIVAMPSDPVPHELRALTLFAMGRYNDAAAGLNPLLAVAPGWNWETMRSLYPDVATYTTQLRSLEGFVTAHPDDAAAHFVLGYHYLVTNYTDSAKKQLQRVVDLQPKDRVAQQLLSGLSPAATPTPATGGVAAVPDVDAGESAPADASTDVIGAWSTKSGDNTINIVLADDGKFTWTTPIGVAPAGAAPAAAEPRTITGKYTLSGNVLVFEGSGGETMVGKVMSRGTDGFQFRLVGAPEEDKGLEFARGAAVAKPAVDAPVVEPAIPADAAPVAPPVEVEKPLILENAPASPKEF